jgi:hypoxanthine phosphoribosyltransferase
LIAREPFPAATVIASAADVGRAYRRLAAQLQPSIDAADCVLLGVMMGGLIPMARLATMLEGDFAMDFCQVSRYRGDARGGALEWVQRPRLPVAGRTALIVDDIFDEGITLDYVVRACRELGAAQVVSVVLVRKRHDRVAVATRPDLVGLEVDDRYVFGCGMDYRHRWRHLPEIYALSADS